MLNTLPNPRELALLRLAAQFTGTPSYGGLAAFNSRNIGTDAPDFDPEKSKSAFRFPLGAAASNFNTDATDPFNDAVKKRTPWSIG